MCIKLIKKIMGKIENQNAHKWKKRLLRKVEGEAREMKHTIWKDETYNSIDFLKHVSLI